jgi:hypothetical protein
MMAEVSRGQNGDGRRFGLSYAIPERSCVDYF